MKQNKIPRNEYIIKPKGKTDPYKDDVQYTNLGQWKYPGQVTKIPSNDITMQGVNYPVYGEDDLGYGQMMYPGMDYTFPGQYVTEIPMAQKGKQVEDNDSWLENIAEIVDPTGISSWDDVYRAYKNKGIGKEVALELLGSIPLLGKVKKAGRLVDDLANAFAITKRQKNNAKITSGALKGIGKYGPSAGRVTDAVQAVLGAKDDSGFTWDMRHGEVPKYDGRNIFPQIELGEHGDFAYGGNPSLPNIEDSGWLDEYQVGGPRFGDLRPTSDATRVVIPNLPKKTLTKKEKQEVKQYEIKQAARDLEKAQKIVDKFNRIKAANKAQAEQGFPTTRQEWADQTQAIGDKLSLQNLPVVGKYIPDLLDVTGGIGSMASGLGSAPLRAQQEDSYKPYLTSIGMPLVTGALSGLGTKSTGQFVNNLVNPIAGLDGMFIKDVTKGLAKDVAKTLDRKIITPIQFYKQIKELKKVAAKQHEYFQKPEVVKKLEDIGASPIAIKTLQTPGQVNLKFIPNIGSHFDNTLNHINIDMRELKEGYDRFGITPLQAYEHELGHQMQKTINVGSPKFQEAYDIYKKKLDDYNMEKQISTRTEGKSTNLNPMAVRSKPDFLVNWNKPEPPVAKSKPTLLDKQASGMLRFKPKDKKLMTPEEKKILSYYHSEDSEQGISRIGYDIEEGTERLPHLREMRQAMVDSKIIPDALTPITEQHIKDFIKLNPKNRIAQIIDPNFQTNYKKLVKTFKHLPAVLPIGLGVEALQQEQNGGWLDNYEDEFKKGGQKGLKRFTSKNIQTSINDIMLRNETIYGPSGKRRYKPNLKYQDGGESTNWLDDI